MAKKVRVPAYQKSDGTHVRSYERTDPRTKKATEKELPSEDNQDQSFIGEYEEPEEESEKEEEHGEQP